MTDVSSLTVCDPSIKNGDTVYVNNQADTGYTGNVTLIDVSDMQADAQSAGECNAIISNWVANHPWANGVYWTLNSSSGGGGSGGSGSGSGGSGSGSGSGSGGSGGSTNALSNVIISIKKYWEWIIVAFLLLILIAYFLMPKKKAS